TAAATVAPGLAARNIRDLWYRFAPVLAAFFTVDPTFEGGLGVASLESPALPNFSASDWARSSPARFIFQKDNAAMMMMIPKIADPMVTYTAGTRFITSPISHT